VQIRAENPNPKPKGKPKGKKQANKKGDQQKKQQQQQEQQEKEVQQQQQWGASKQPRYEFDGMVEEVRGEEEEEEEAEGEGEGEEVERGVACMETKKEQSLAARNAQLEKESAELDNPMVQTKKGTAVAAEAALVSEVRSFVGGAAIAEGHSKSNSSR